MIKTSGRNETRVETMLRLAAKAQAEGLEVLSWVDGDDVAFFVNSSRITCNLYRVFPQTDAGCDCDGWRKFGYCKHYALVIDALGFLDRFRGMPAARTDEPLDGCDNCGATAALIATDFGGGDVRRLCDTCNALAVEAWLTA